MYIRPLVYSRQALSLTWFLIQTSWLLHSPLWPLSHFLLRVFGISQRLPSIRTRLSTNCASRTLRQLGALTSTTTNPEGKVIVPPILEVKRGIMMLMHDHPTAGHPGQDETLQRTQEKYWWPKMKEWIADYMKGCAVCQQNKILTHRQKVPMYRIPSQAGTLPFQNVAMDLITRLPERHNHNAILSIVDQGCSHAAVFLPCNTKITGAGIAQLYFDNVIWWFGIPSSYRTRMLSLDTVSSCI